MDSNIGKKLDGRYEITELIGVGGMADVYKANDVMENRVVAVKILKPEFSENEEFLRRFRNESKAIAVLSHPNIVKIFDVGFNDDIQFIVMEYIDGITLKEFIEQQGVLKWKDALHFVTQILRALQHAHDKGIVHRDIKPQNIMLFTDGTIKVMDFGIARFSRIDGKTLSDKTIGSVHYISPEQARGDMTDERSDIYSVGVMLYEMLTGKKPFDGDNPVAIALKHMQEEPAAPREIMPSIPEALEEIVLHAMEREPSNRYQSAAEMIKDIDTFKLNPSVVFGYKNKVNNNIKDDEPTQHFKHVVSKPVQTYDDEYYDDVDDEENETTEKKRSYVVPILLAVTVAVIIVAAVVIGIVVVKAFGGASGSHTSTIEIQNFVGHNIVQVEQDWKDKFKFEITNEYNNQYDEGIIFWQSQDPGKSVKEGYTLALKVSKGKQMTTIPEIAGSTAAVAESELKAAGFTVVLRNTYDDKVAEGLVVKTEPAAGKQYPVNGTVSVYVSQGPFDTQVKVPDVIGLTKEKAIAKLKENKLVASVQEIDHEGDKGKVIDQDIEKGKKVDRDSTVTIYVSTGEVQPTEMSIPLPLPTGIHGSYSIEVYKDGNVAFTQQIGKAETIAGGVVNVDIKGKKTETLTIQIRNNESGKSVQYAVYAIDYDKKSATLKGDLNESGLLGITPTTTTTTTTSKKPTTTPSETSSSEDDNLDGDDENQNDEP